MKLIDLVKRYTILLLGKEYKLNKNNMPIVQFFDDNEVEGYFDHNSLTIQLNEASFLYRETLIDDIDTLFHELRHYAQYVAQRKDNESLNKNTTSLPRGSMLVKALTISNFTNDEIEKLIKDDDKIKFKYNVNFDKYFYYLNKLYFLREVEMDARSFSVNTLYDLLFNVDETKFNQTELKNIEFFREKARSAFEDEEEVLFNTESTFAIPKQAMDNEIIALQNNIIQNHPDIFDAIANDQDKLDLINSEMKFDARLALVESLTFMYNDQIAHKLMSSLLESIKNDSENALLYDYYSDVSNLYVFSNFQFNQEELEKFSNGGSSGNDEVISILNKNRKIYNEYLQDVERQN